MTPDPFFQDRAGKWRYHIIAANNKILVTSEAYASRGNAERGLEDLKRVLCGGEQ